MIDDEDARLVIGREWHGHKREDRDILYARSNRDFLHHLVLGVKPDFRRPVEHLDQDGLNCQKVNLMVSTISRNKLNRLGRAQRNRLDSEHCGVSFDKRTGKWQGRIGAAHFWYSLGTYETEAEAAAKVTEVRDQLLAMPYDQWESFMSQYRLPEKLSREVLEQKYTVERMSLKKIADEIGSTAPTINRWLREYGIPLRVPGKRTYQATY